MAAFGLLALLVLGGLVGLRSQAVRGWILDRATAAIESASGLHITAGDFTISFHRGQLGLHDVTIRGRGPDSAPIFTAPDVQTTVSWTSLLSDRPQIHRVIATSPQVDLAAPLPAPRETPDEPSGDLFPDIDIHLLEITKGSIRSGELGDNFDSWLDSWQADRVNLSGELLEGSAKLEIEPTTLAITSHRRPPILADVAAELMVDKVGLVAIDELRVSGESLELAVAGSGRLAADEPIAARIDLRADLAQLVPDLTHAGELRAIGDLTFTAAPQPRLAGFLEATGQGFPAELLQPILALADIDGWRLDGTQIDLEADLNLRVDLARLTESLDNDVATGTARLTWRRQEEPLLVAAAQIEESPEGDSIIRGSLDIQLLPEAAGRRSLEGDFHLPGWTSLKELELTDMTMRIDQQDLRKLATKIGWSPDAFGGLRPAGSLSLVARATGPVATPDLDLEGSWRLAGDSLIELSAQTSARSRLAIQADLLADSAGQRRIAGTWRFPGISGPTKGFFEDVKVEIDLPSLESSLAQLDDLLTILVPDANRRAVLLAPLTPAVRDRLVGGVRAQLTGSGPLAAPDIDLQGSWRIDDQSLLELSAQASAMSALAFRADLLANSAGRRSITGEWRFPGIARFSQGAFDNLDIQIDLPDLEGALAEIDKLAAILVPDPGRRTELLAPLTPAIRDRLVGALRAHLKGSGSLAAPQVELTATWAATDSEHLSLTAQLADDVVTLESLSGALAGLTPDDRILNFTAHGRIGIEAPIRDASLTVQIVDLLADIHQIDVRTRLSDGTLNVQSSTPGIPGALEATIPLALLLQILPEPELLADLPLVFDTGSLEIEITRLDLQRATEIGLYLAGFEESNLQITGLLDALLTLDPRQPLAAVGAVEIGDLRVIHRQTRIEAARDLQIDLDEGRVALLPARLWVRSERDEAPLDLKLSAKMDPDWQPSAGLLALIDDLDLDLHGEIESSLLTPFLAGGIAEGPVFFQTRVQGDLDSPVAEIRIDGRGASLVLPGKYRTQIRKPEIEIGIGPSGAEIRTGRMQLNRGEVSLRGGLDEDWNLRLGAELEGVRYRLDYGLTVVVDGDLELSWPRQGRRRLTGTIDLERGSLRRDLRLEQELIRMLNPSDLAGGASALAKSIDLDLQLITREGVRIRNNVADLRADWDLIRVRGTLAQPALDGSIDIDPGGLISAYGQTVRIDQGSLIFSGLPGEPPRLDFETTTSSEDPRLRDPWNSVWSSDADRKGPGGGFWDRYDPRGSANAFNADEVATGLTSYLQNRLLQSVSGGAPRVELSVQPLPLMGETDTTARVTMSYRLTPQIAYVLSQNPREAEGRTDILNLHNFALAPSMRAQIFRNDQGNQGVTLQQMLEFGGARRAEDSLPRLRSIDLVAPDGFRKRQVRRATGLRRGQPVAEGAEFDIELDMIETLAQRGYPAADVEVQVAPTSRNRVDVAVAIEPGANVDFEFTGDTPQRRARRDIIALYQPTELERSPALDTVRQETVRALHARGFLDPQVEVTADRLDPADRTGDRIVRVHGIGGRQIDPRILEFPGLPEDVEAALVTVFSSRLSRVELAAGKPEADSLLTQSLQTVGYNEAQIRARELSADGSTLGVEIEPGPRRHLTTVEIVGADPELRAELDELRELEPGDPLRSGQIARTTLLMEDYLRGQGFAEATVQARYEPSTEGNPGDIDLSFVIDRGREHRIGDVRTTGLANSPPKWVERISGLETGELLTDDALTLARRQLARTGIFQRIAIRREEAADPEATPVSTPITLELEEHPRYRVTYGVRGESTREAGVVAEVSDLNFLGRGQTLGLRLIYSTLERNARLYWSIPRVRQSNKTLEFFLEARREELDDKFANIREAWAQLTFPVGRRSVHRAYTVYKRSVTEDRSLPDTAPEEVVSPYTGWQISFDTGERSFFETSIDRRTVFLGSDLSFSSESLGSDYTGYGWFGQVKPQIPLIKTRDSALVWVHNYRVGLRESQDDELPFFDRLFAGGEFSVRGYPTNSLGPRDEDGTPLGGEALFVTNQELRFPIWTLLSGVAFFDAGNVWVNRQAVDSTLFKSIGLGLRAESPVGPLRLDFAYPLDRREGDPEYKIYFGLGQTF